MRQVIKRAGRSIHVHMLPPYHNKHIKHLNSVRSSRHFRILSKCLLPNVQGIDILIRKTFSGTHHRLYRPLSEGPIALPTTNRKPLTRTSDKLLDDAHQTPTYHSPLEHQLDKECIEHCPDESGGTTGCRVEGDPDGWRGDEALYRWRVGRGRGKWGREMVRRQGSRESPALIGILQYVFPN